MSNCLRQPSSATAGANILLPIAELQRKHQQGEAELIEKFQATQDVLKVPAIFLLNFFFFVSGDATAFRPQSSAAAQM